jgi:integrase
MASSAAPQRDADTGTWWFIIDLGPGPGRDGKWRDRRQAKRRGFATKKAAQAALDDLRIAAREQSYVTPTNQTIDEFLLEWLEAASLTLEPSTHESYVRNMRLHVSPRIGKLRLQQIDAGTLNRLYAALLRDGRASGKGGLSPKTVRYIHTTLHAAFEAGVRWGRLHRNPAHFAEPPSARRARSSVMRTWSAEEVTRFLTSAKRSRYRTVWLFLLTTGCRRGEALGLRWEDVDLDHSIATLRQTITAIKGSIHRSGTTKTGKTRRVQLDKVTVEALRRWKARQARERLALGGCYADEGLVFCYPDGRPHHPNTFSWIFDDHIKRHGLPRIRLHDLRHTWATLALEQGIHPKVVQERLGHSSVTVTLDIYSHVSPALESDAADRIARLMTDGVGE